MKAIILAAGRGSRMKQLTEHKPKCLLELGGKSLLAWQTEALLKAGISNIAIVRGYRKESFRFSCYQYLENQEWEHTNMVYSLFCASPLLEKFPCLISYSDIIYHPSIINALKKTPDDVGIAYDEKWKVLWEERFKDPLEDAETFKTAKGKLLAIGAKASSLQEIDGQYMGLLKITPKGWKKIKKTFYPLPVQAQKKLDMTSLLQMLIHENIHISTIPIQGKWCEVDREEDLILYQQKLNVSGWTHNWR